jgi:uncharacterized protein YjiS (DUF1127 family)
MATLVHHPLTIYHRASAHTTTGPRAWVGNLLASWKRRRDAREAYAQMTERDLGDAGLARWEIERELARSFWHD